MTGRAERKLFEHLRDDLPGGEELLAAAVVFTGPEPNLVGFVEDLLSSKSWTNRRKYFTVIVTDRRVVLAKNDDEHSPAHVSGQWAERTVIGGHHSDPGDAWIMVDGAKYWFWPEWTAQIEEIARLAAV